MKWFWAERRDSERWMFAGDSREEALSFGTDGYVAPEMDGQSDSEFWKAVASLLMGQWEYIEESLAEESLIDPDDAWVSRDETPELEAEMAEWLMRQTVVKRPEWSAVDVSKAEAVRLGEGG